MALCISEKSNGSQLRAWYYTSVFTTLLRTIHVVILEAVQIRMKRKNCLRSPSSTEEYELLLLVVALPCHVNLRPACLSYLRYLPALLYSMDSWHIRCFSGILYDALISSAATQFANPAEHRTHAVYSSTQLRHSTAFYGEEPRLQC